MALEFAVKNSEKNFNVRLARKKVAMFSCFFFIWRAGRFFSALT
jgi:hypothetical protein